MEDTSTNSEIASDFTSLIKRRMNEEDCNQVNAYIRKLLIDINEEFVSPLRATERIRAVILGKMSHVKVMPYLTLMKYLDRYYPSLGRYDESLRRNDAIGKASRNKITKALIQQLNIERIIDVRTESKDTVVLSIGEGWQNFSLFTKPYVEFFDDKGFE